jgi:AAA domain-containing protein
VTLELALSRTLAALVAGVPISHLNRSRMSLLKPASRPSYLKAGILGFAKAGKTHTALELALGTRAYFKLPGPIAMYDTESGSEYWADRVRSATGTDMVTVKSRSLVDLIEAVKECVDGGVSVLVVDSVTHVWREVCDAYLAELQEAARKKKWREPDRLEFQDWSRIKAKWGEWPDLYLTSPLHIIVCGRAGYEYEFETNDRGKKELTKTGIKMKVEGEFGFEPSLLIEMERDWSKEEPPRMVNRARVIGDRLDLMNGQSCDFPTFDFFRSFVEKLAPAGHHPVDLTVKTEFGLDSERHDDWKREKDRREVLAEKIAAAFTLAGMDGKTNDDKKNRTEMLLKFWQSTSWKEISEKTPSATLAAGLRKFELAHGLMGDDLPPEFNAPTTEATQAS